jgi:hypothetical protein
LVNTTVALYFVFVTVVVVLNLVATVCLIRSAVYSASQKALQLVLIWVLPFVGAILVISVWAHDRVSASAISFATKRDHGSQVLVQKATVLTTAAVSERAPATTGTAAMWQSGRLRRARGTTSA